MEESSAKIEKLLECPICLEKNFKPKMLPCQHTFCLKCSREMTFKEIIGRGRFRYIVMEIKCALCRKWYDLFLNSIFCASYSIDKLYTLTSKLNSIIVLYFFAVISNIFLSSRFDILLFLMMTNVLLRKWSKCLKYHDFFCLFFVM